MRLPFIVSFDIFFRAKIAPVNLWIATQTTPNLPSPSFLPRMKSYRQSPLLFGLGFATVSVIYLEEGTAATV